MLADAVASRNTDVVEEFADQVEVIEDLVLNGEAAETEALPRLFSLKRALGAAVSSVEIAEPTLEDAFLAITGRSFD